jgi:gluconolactonase
MLYPVSEVRVVVAGLDHPECVAVGRDGTLYAGGERGQVYRISPDGKKTEEIASTGGFCLGLTLDREENIYICDLNRHALLKVTQKGAVTLVADTVDGVKIRTPNFSVFDSQGNLFFSDSGEWKKGDGVVWRLSREGKTSLFSAGPYHFANGMALDAQERYLYVVESNRDRNFYVTTYASNCIYRVSPNRQVELLCKDEENLLLCQPTNCAFGGPNFDQLYVSNLGRDHISVLDLKAKGQQLWTHRNTT